MREIKFRVYLNGKVHYWGFIDDGDGVVFSGPPVGGGLTIEELQQASEQFIGILDENGVEIYDGDRVSVIEIHHPSSPKEKRLPPLIRIVTWHPFLCGFNLAHPAAETHGDSEPWIINSQAMELEVLGTIKGEQR